MNFGVFHPAYLVYPYQKSLVESSILKFGLTEIYQQPYFNPGRFQVVNNLRLMLRGQGLDRFQFQNNLVLNDDIGKKLADDFPAKTDSDRHLGFRSNAFLSQCSQKRLFVNRFDKTGPKFVYDLEAGLQYFLC